MAVTHTWSIIRLEQLNDGTGTVVNIGYNVFSEDEISCNSSGGVQLNIDNIENVS